MDCIHRNGNITGYVVQYGVQGSGSVQRKNVSGGASMEATLTGLTENSTYYIEVAAANSAGIGNFSNFLAIRTNSKTMYISYSMNLPNLHVKNTHTYYIE